MFYRGYSVLTTLARPEAVPVPRAPGALADQVEANAMRALNRDLPAMRISERLADPAGYLRLQRARRQALEALLPITPEKSAVSRAIDLVGMIAEESSWSANTALQPFEDDNHPDIDFQCAETAVLLGWVRRSMGEALDAVSPRIANHMLSEVRRRVFAPFMAHGDYPFMRGRGMRPLAILCDILLAAILLETDGNRRASVLKHGMRLLDQAIAARKDLRIPLADSIADIGAITDISILIKKITRGELDLTPVYPTPDWLDELLFAWAEGEYFVDPAGESMRPDISGEELFRIGLAANDEALTALGARIYSAHRRPSATVTGRILDMSCAGMLAAENRRPPRLKHAATAGNRLMVSRFSGMTFAMHSGGNRANAGDIALFAGGKPVFVSLPEQTNLPTIAWNEQLAKPDLPCEADFEVRRDRELMSIDLTHAYPAASVIRSVQRTAMVLRNEGTLRIVDAFDLSEPGLVAFRFITPEKIVSQPGFLQIGPIDFAWEGELTPNISLLPPTLEFPAGLNKLELITPAPIARAFFTFNAALREG